MGSMRSEVCNGLFRSSTNLAAFENMLSSLSGVAKTTGPESGNDGFDNFGEAGWFCTASRFADATPVVKAPKSGVTTLVLVEVEKYKKCCGAEWLLNYFRP